MSYQISNQLYGLPPPSPYSLDSPSYSDLYVEPRSVPMLATNQDSFFDDKGYDNCLSLTSTSSPTGDSYGFLNVLPPTPLMGGNQDVGVLDPDLGYLPARVSWVNNPPISYDNNFINTSQKELPMFDTVFPNLQSQLDLSYQASSLSSSTPHCVLPPPTPSYSAQSIDSSPVPQNPIAELSESLWFTDFFDNFDLNHLEACIPEAPGQPSEDSHEIEPESCTQSQPTQQNRGRTGRPRKFSRIVRGKTILAPGSLKRCDFEGCNKKFVRQEHLKRHQRIHFSDKTYDCRLCEKPFSRFDNMFAHVKLHDKRSPERQSRRTKYYPEAAELIRELSRSRRRVVRCRVVNKTAKFGMSS